MLLVLALLVIPALVLEETSSGELQAIAFGLYLFIWIGFAAELAFILAVPSGSESLAQRSSG